MKQHVARLLGIPEDSPHLETALSHPSWANETRAPADNQRLEFLGDAVLGLCASELLCESFPGADEGALTRMRAELVNGDALAEWARLNDVAPALRLGRGAEATGLRQSPSVLADAVEALIGAVYLDAGLDAARAACRRVVEPRMAEAAAARDPKSELQELLQARGGEPPTYHEDASGGPAHDRWFEVTVRHRGRTLASGRGRSKRQAERAAATAALLVRAWESGEANASDASKAEDGSRAG